MKIWTGWQLEYTPRPFAYSVGATAPCLQVVNQVVQRAE